MNRRHRIALTAFAGLAPVAAAQTTWLVSNNPAESPHFTSLYAALESPLVVNGDTVEVSQGLGGYTTPMDTWYDFHDKAITVRAQTGERPVLSSSWSSAVVGTTFRFQGEGPGSVLDGFEIRPGGQIAISVEGASPTIRNCVFPASGRDTTLDVRGGHPRFESCVFEGISGGGFNQYIRVVSSATFVDCTFRDAENPFGTFDNRGNLNLIGCDFIANASGLHGDISSSGTLWVESCRFIDTSKPHPNFPDKQSVIVASGPTTIVNSLFQNSSHPERPLITLSAQGTPAFRFVANCTFVNNPVQSIVSAQGVAGAAVSNSVVWGNAIGGAAFDGAVIVDHSDIQAGWPGTGNINQNPLFRNAAGGDYRLDDGSPAIDRGSNAAVPAGITLDLRGDPRFVDDPNTPNPGGTPGPVVDMGAYEFQDTICLPDLTTTANPLQPGFGTPNGIVNNEDFFYYLLLFSASNPLADMTTTAVPGTPGYGTPNGVINNDDFFYYLAIFAAGCD